MELLERGPFLDALAVYAADALSGLGRLAHDPPEPPSLADEARGQESGQIHPTTP